MRSYSGGWRNYTLKKPQKLFAFENEEEKKSRGSVPVKFIGCHNVTVHSRRRWSHHTHHQFISFSWDQTLSWRIFFFLILFGRQMFARQNLIHRELDGERTLPVGPDVWSLKTRAKNTDWGNKNYQQVPHFTASGIEGVFPASAAMFIQGRNARTPAYVDLGAR